MFKALSDISFRVHDGEFISIVGPNGAGKTTLVNVVTGLLRPTAGEVRFLGRDIAGIGPVELARLGMSRAFQLVNIFPALTVTGNAWRRRSRRACAVFPIRFARSSGITCCRPMRSASLKSLACVPAR